MRNRSFKACKRILLLFLAATSVLVVISWVASLRSQANSSVDGLVGHAIELPADPLEARFRSPSLSFRPCLVQFILGCPFCVNRISISRRFSLRACMFGLQESLANQFQDWLVSAQANGCAGNATAAPERWLFWQARLSPTRLGAPLQFSARGPAATRPCRRSAAPAVYPASSCLSPPT